MAGFRDFATAHGLAFPVLTERLALAPFTEADARDVWEYWRLPETVEWLSRRFADPVDMTAYWRSTGNQLMARERDSGTVVGDFMVRIQDAWAQDEVAAAARSTQAELGWTLAPGFHGKGYAAEAAAGLLDAVFGLGVRRVEASCFADNAPSWRLMERLGMRREALCVKESLHRDRGWVDGMQYAILREEWEARRSDVPGVTGTAGGGSPV